MRDACRSTLATVNASIQSREQASQIDEAVIKRLNLQGIGRCEVRSRRRGLDTHAHDPVHAHVHTQRYTHGAPPLPQACTNPILNERDLQFQQKCALIEELAKEGAVLKRCGCGKDHVEQ